MSIGWDKPEEPVAYTFVYLSLPCSFGSTPNSLRSDIATVALMQHCEQT